MIRKLLEAFFRHKLILVLPVILIPAIVTPIALMSNPPQYETGAGVWVDHPGYLNYKEFGNPYLTPALNTTAKLNELLHTRAFMVDVARRTSLAPLVGSPSGEARINDFLSRGVTLATPGDHIIVVHVQAPTARLAMDVTKAVLDAYQEKAAADLADQSSLATDFYQSRVEDSRQQLNQASQALRRYVVGLQASTADASQPTTDQDKALVPTSMLDPKLAALQSNVQAAQTQFNTAQAALTQAQHDAVAATQGQQLGFQVIDPAATPLAPTPQTKKIIVYPIAALVAGLGLSTILLVLFVASDRSVRSELDLVAGPRVLGTVPMLKLKRVPKQLRAAATRRAIGVAAGTALPAASVAK